MRNMLPKQDDGQLPTTQAGEEIYLLNTCLSGSDHRFKMSSLLPRYLSSAPIPFSNHKDLKERKGALRGGTRSAQSERIHVLCALGALCGERTDFDLASSYSWTKVVVSPP